MKGLFTQGAVVLLERAIDVEALGRALEGFGGASVGEDSDGWMGRPGVMVPVRPEVNGYAVADVVDVRWPDHMGDPQREPELFAAWNMGWFGPFAYPRNLERAQTMNLRWDDALSVSARHAAFVRIKTTYVLGADDDALVMPEDYAPLPELELVTRLARAVLELPEALAYFNPNGEVLLSRELFDREIAFHRERDLLPLPVWANIRRFRADEWTLMDTIGMEQLDVDDHEACFPGGAYDPGEVAYFLRNSTLYVFDNGPIIENGDTMDGPGGIRWQGFAVEESLAARPRDVLRWFPLDGSKAPPRLAP